MDKQPVGLGIDCLCLNHGFMITFDHRVAHVTWRGKKVRGALVDVVSYMRGFDPIHHVHRDHALTLIQKDGTVTLIVVDVDGQYEERQWKDIGDIEHMFVQSEPHYTLLISTQYVCGLRFCQLRKWQVPVIQWSVSRIQQLMVYT